MDNEKVKKSFKDLVIRMGSAFKDWFHNTFCRKE